MQLPIKIGILGFGNVGRSLVQLLLADDNLRYDIEVFDKRSDAKGAFLDLSHSSMTTKRHEMRWVPELAPDLHYVFHSAGPSVGPHKPRLSVAQESYDINKEIFATYRPNSDCRIIIISNPVDIVARAVAEMSGVDRKNVIGTGTYIDQVRFEFYLSYYFQEHPSAVEALVLGEHGDSQVQIISQTFLNNKRFLNPENRPKVKKAIERTVRAAQEIKETQNVTFYGAAACAFHVLKKFESSEPSHIPLSVGMDDFYREKLGLKDDVFLSLPLRIKDKEYNVEQEIELTEEEWSGLQKSAKRLADCWNGLTRINE